MILLRINNEYKYCSQNNLMFSRFNPSNFMNNYVEHLKVSHSLVTKKLKVLTTTSGLQYCKCKICKSNKEVHAFASQDNICNKCAIGKKDKINKLRSDYVKKLLIAQGFKKITPELIDLKRSQLILKRML